VCLFLVFILEVSAAIAAFVMQSQVKGMLIRTMHQALQEYDNDPYVAAGVDFMQSGVSLINSVTFPCPKEKQVQKPQLYEKHIKQYRKIKVLA